MDALAQGFRHGEIPESGLRQYLIHDLAERATPLAGLVGERCRDAGSRQGCHDLLARTVLDLRQELGSRPEYRSAFEAAVSCNPTETHPWRFHLLTETSVLRIGLLTVYRFAPVPIHDHPGSHGAQLVLAGKVRIRQYDRPGESCPNLRVVTLDKVADKELSPDGCTTYTPFSCNIHELNAISSRSVLLSLVIHPSREENCSWYFPATLYPQGARGVYSRVAKRKPRCQS